MLEIENETRSKILNALNKEHDIENLEPIH